MVLGYLVVLILSFEAVDPPVGGGALIRGRMVSGSEVGLGEFGSLCYVVEGALMVEGVVFV